MVKIPPGSGTPINFSGSQPSRERLPHETTPSLKSLIPELFTILNKSLTPDDKAMLHEVDKDFKKKFPANPLAAKKAAESISLRAAKEANLPILEWALSRHVKFTGAHTNAAASSGNLEVLKWVHEHGGSTKTWGLCRRAVESGNVEVIEWALESEAPFELMDLYSNAAAVGAVSSLTWLQKHHTQLLKNSVKPDQTWEQCSPNILWSAIEHGHKNVLEWANQNAAFSDEVWNMPSLEGDAITFNQLEILGWLQIRRTLLSDDKEIP